ncbi:MAG: hypothetical protein LBH69_00710, partial [Methanomassiliicoccaceae archaeon]|nr:hypothetical protein [Methanomassiliicoccaceae archaeon]
MRRISDRKGGGAKALSVMIATLFVITAFAAVLNTADTADNDDGSNDVLGADTVMPMIATGDLHSLVLKSDGTVWAWGYNYYGQVGGGTNDDRNTPVQVLGPEGEGHLTGVIAVAAGWYFSIAIKSDGTVWACGQNSENQLGDGTDDDRNTPVQVLGPDGDGYLTGVIAVTGGATHSLALKSDGTVWAWGENSHGQLGDGTNDSSNTPVQVLDPDGDGNLTGVKAIAAGSNHSLALKNDGTVWAWGYNDSGQLGDNTLADKRTPVQ